MSAEAVFKRISATNVLPGMQRSDNNEKPYNTVSYSGTSGDIDGLWQQLTDRSASCGLQGVMHLFDFLILASYIYCVFISYASPHILFSSLFPYLASPLLIFSLLKNRPTPFPGQML